MKLKTTWITFTRLSLYLAFLPSLAFCQKYISGRVIEKESGQPIYLANVHLVDHMQKEIWGTVTDDQGYFQLFIPPEFVKDTVHLTHIGYKSFIFKLDSIRNASALILPLQEDVRTLQQVTVSALTPKQYILQCIKRRQANYFNAVFAKGCFYWQWVKENDAYRYLSQSFLSIKESLNSRSMHAQLEYDSVISNDPYYNLPFLDKIDDMLVFDIMRKGSHFMNIQNIDEWDFQYDNDPSIGTRYVGINATTLDKSVTLKLLINDNNYAVEQVEYAYHWKPDQYHRLNDSLLYRLDALKGRIIYKENASKYYLQFIQNRIEYSSFRKLTYKKETDRVIENELVVFSCHEGETDRKTTKRHSAPYFQGSDEIIINKKSFCDAAAALKVYNKACIK